MITPIISDEIVEKARLRLFEASYEEIDVSPGEMRAALAAVLPDLVAAENEAVLWLSVRLYPEADDLHDAIRARQRHDKED